MSRRSRQLAAAIMLCLLAVGCQADDPAKSAACDPRNVRADALMSEASLHAAPHGYRLTRQGVSTSRYDKVETHQCSDVLLYFTVTPVKDPMAALQALGRHAARTRDRVGWDDPCLGQRAAGDPKPVVGVWVFVRRCRATK